MDKLEQAKSAIKDIESSLVGEMRHGSMRLATDDGLQLVQAYAIIAIAEDVRRIADALSKQESPA